jgi:mRNA-degrading endonuclease YafQ of YafQ-DinJ toxin-antitoxin module
MRTLIWSNTFLRAFKRLLKKQPDRREEIEKTLRLLLDNPFNPKHTNLGENFQGHGRVVLDTTFESYLTL